MDASDDVISKKSRQQLLQLLAVLNQILDLDLSEIESSLNEDLCRDQEDNESDLNFYYHNKYTEGGIRTVITKLKLVQRDLKVYGELVSEWKTK